MGFLMQIDETKEACLKGSLLFLGGLLLVIGLGASACAPLAKDNPINPSYRLVTNQILEMDSALGTRGGLAALTQTSAPPSLPPRMTHGSSIDPASFRSTEEVKLNWVLIGRRVSTIEDAWVDVRLELDRRQPGEADESWNTWYEQYYRIMGTKHYFDSSLDYVKAYIATKDRERIELSVLQLTDAYLQVKEELKISDIDGRRPAFVSAGFVGILAALTITASLVARRRDRKFVRPPRPAQPSQPSRR